MVLSHPHAMLTHTHSGIGRKVEHGKSLIYYKYIDLSYTI